MHWHSPPLNSYDGIDPNDFLTALPGYYRSDDKPLLLHVFTDKAEAAARIANVEQDVFHDPDLALGSRLFNAIEIDGDRLTSANPWFQLLSGQELPRVIVLDSTGHRVGTVEGNDVTAPAVYKLMKKAAAKTFATELATFVKESRALLDQAAQIDARLGVIAEQKKTASETKGAKLAAEEAKLTQELDDLRVRNTALIERTNQERKVAKS